jgi:hypothetical protein
MLPEANTAIATDLDDPEPEVQYVDDDSDDYEVVAEEQAEEERPEPRRRRRDRDRDHDEDDYPRERKISKRGMRRGQLQKVDLGLAFHYWQYLLVLGSLLLSILQVLLAAAPPLAFLVGLLGSIATLVAPILGIVGSILCCWAPPKSEARGLVLFSLGFDAASLVTVPFAFVAGFVAGEYGLAVAVGLLLLAWVFSLTGFVLFMMFLSKLAYYLDDEPAGREATAAMGAYLAAYLGGGFVVLCTLALLARTGLLLFLLLLLLESIVWLVFIIKVLFRILNVISGVRARI